MTAMKTGSGRSERRRERQRQPRKKTMEPAVRGHLRLRVRVMRWPVRAPVAEEAIVGRMRRRPEEVALERRTAWK